MDSRQANSNGYYGELTRPAVYILPIRVKSNPAGKEYGGVACREKGGNPRLTLIGFLLLLRRELL
jgi:hypothetical protein